MSRLLLIGLGGALGTMARYLIGIGASRAFGSALPYGTLLVNALGCFLIAIVAYAAFVAGALSPTMRLAISTGFLGGLTTYSSFNLETTELLRERAFSLAVLNVGLTVGGCFAAGLLGLALAQRVFGP